MNQKILVGVLVGLLLISSGTTFYFLTAQKKTAPTIPVSRLASPTPAVVKNIIGGDQDEHGCLPSTGYSWCEEKNKCLRQWEETCEKVSTESSPVAQSETISWKTYENEDLGFSFNYPADWKIRQGTGNKYAPIDGSVMVEASQVVCCQFSFDEGMDFKVVFSSDLSKYPDIEKLLVKTREGHSAGAFNVGRYFIGNFEGVQVKTKTGSNFGYEEYAKLYSKTKTGFYFVRWSSVDPNKKGFTAENYLEKILATFSFTE